MVDRMLGQLRRGEGGHHKGARGRPAAAETQTQLALSDIHSWRGRGAYGKASFTPGGYVTLGLALRDIHSWRERGSWHCVTFTPGRDVVLVAGRLSLLAGHCATFTPGGYKQDILRRGRIANRAV
ncbi:hypothetical protein E2C01_030853 [Portunus trituberculatus]|uniref:Uncharacterized protein n=1 Tax=Portunus trituberculatus TaxID=210409 RepID=A0A5B7EWF9_PORTR|nr:hypothetical protein [Portunus trituberculatus]